MAQQLTTNGKCSRQGTYTYLFVYILSSHTSLSTEAYVPTPWYAQCLTHGHNHIIPFLGLCHAHKFSTSSSQSYSKSFNSQLTQIGPLQTKAGHIVQKHLARGKTTQRDLEKKGYDLFE